MRDRSLGLPRNQRFHGFVANGLLHLILGQRLWSLPEKRPSTEGAIQPVMGEPGAAPDATGWLCGEDSMRPGTRKLKKNVMFGRVALIEVLLVHLLERCVLAQIPFYSLDFSKNPL